jgi:hypothetical protein
MPCSLIVSLVLVQPYSNDPKDIKNNFIHLTNYSVNKNSGEFVYNEAPGK